MNGRPLTIRKLAESAGVSPATVSRALRNDPRISPAVRRKLQKKASKCGYRPDPHIAELMQYLKKRPAGTRRALIAWINHRHEENFWHSLPWAGVFLQAARRSAGTGGYNLDEIWLGPYERRIPEKRIVQILTARGITGLLIPPFIDRKFPWTLPWEKFCAVSIGLFPFEPRLSFVDSNDYHNTLLCCRMLRARGKTRIGLVLFAEHLGEDNPFTAAVFQEAFSRGIRPCPPLLLNKGGSLSKRMFQKWFEKNRPDCIISDNPLSVREFQTGDTTPSCLVHLNASGDPGPVHWSGIDQKQAALCAAAVEHLAVRLQNNQYGLPEHTVNILIEGSWISGETA